MKICYAASYLPTHHKHLGGAEQACYRLGKLLTAHGHEVSYLSIKPNKPVEEELDFHPVKTFEDFLNNDRFAYLVRGFKRIFFLPFDFVAYFDSKRILKKLRPDVLHVHNFSILTFAIIQSAKELGIPVVYSVYDNWCFCPLTTLIKKRDYFSYDWEICRDFHGLSCLNCKFEIPLIQKLFAPLRKPFFDFFLNKIDAFIAINSNSEQMMVEYGIPKEKISVISLPLQKNMHKASRKTAENPEENTILFVGWLGDRKGPHVAVQAMRGVLKKVPNAKLYLVGPETDLKTYLSRLKDLIKKEGLEKNVHLLGKKTANELFEIMNTAKVVIVPEQWEIAIPIILTEAMLLEKATVSSRIGGIPAFIDDGENGLLADPKDPADFAKKIVWLIKHPAKAAEFGKCARKKVLEICDEDTISTGLTRLYSSLAKK